MQNGAFCAFLRVFARFCAFWCVSVCFLVPKWPAEKRKFAHNRAKMCKKRFFAIPPLVIPPFACHRHCFPWGGLLVRFCYPPPLFLFCAPPPLAFSGSRWFVGAATTQNLVVKFDGEICGGVLVENASDDFPQ